MRPYDSESQVLGQEAPEELLELFTGLRGAEVARADPKLSLSSVQPDHLYRTGPGLTHLEFAKQYRDAVPAQLLRHREYLSLAYPDVEVDQHLVLMCQSDAPKLVQAFYRKRIGKYEQRIDFEVVRLWEMDPERAFALKHPALLPWVLVMRASPAQMVEAVKRMSVDQRAATLLHRAATLAPLRLERSALDEIMAKGRKPMKIRELVEGTWLYDDIFEDGEREGLAKGLERGREEGSRVALRQSIRRLAAKRIPSCDSLPGLDSVESTEELEQCLEDLGLADSTAAARRAVERYADGG